MPKHTEQHVLVVEDERSMAKALELKLAGAGFAVTVAFDGEDALARIAETYFDCILLDLIMPKIDGFGVLERMKERKVQTRVIVLTNLSQQEDEKRAKALGAVDFIVKSDTPLSEIVERVRATLHADPRADQRTGSA